MEIEVSAVFQEFADTHLAGHGLEAYRLQRKEILAFEEPQGHF